MLRYFTKLVLCTTVVLLSTRGTSTAHPLLTAATGGEATRWGGKVLPRSRIVRPARGRGLYRLGRPSSAADVEAVHSLHQSLFKGQPEWGARVEADTSSARVLRHLAGHPARGIRVEQIIGEMLLLHTLARGTVPPFSYLASVSVHPALQRRGLGELLVESGIREAQKLGAESLYLHVRGTNEAALGLYRKLGFGQFAPASAHADQATSTPAPFPIDPESPLLLMRLALQEPQLAPSPANRSPASHAETRASAPQ
ncbi:MAG: GNAT family N-acetyltransferase [Proteobacteria bacterium]|nr:GNAT family N-acetyltransferase [Pseudomonadota bacterium]